MRTAAVVIEPTAAEIVATLDAASTRSDYGAALDAIGKSSRFTDAELGDLARAMGRCWARVSQMT
jgi:hypothetical protein